MKTLFVSSYYLFKDTRFGGSKRLYYFAKELENYGDVHVICHDGCGEVSGGGDIPASGFKHFLYAPVVETRTAAAKFFRPGINIEKFLAANRGMYRDFLGATEFDAVLCAFPLTLSYLGTIVPRAGRTVVYLEDDLLLETVRAEKHRNPFDVYRAVRLRQLHAYYAKKLSFVNTFISITAEENEVVKRLFPGTNTRVLKYGVPLDEYPLLPPPPQGFTAGFIGNFRHRPNAEALHWFLGTVYPLCKKVVPAMTMVVAGKSIPPDLRAVYSGDPSITWEEDVRDIACFYKKVTVFVNPIVSGKGLRTKLIEAAAFGRPIISTGLGAEGLEDLAISMADTGRDFAESCRKLFSDRAYYAGVSEGNRNAVEQTYSLSAVGRQLAAILRGE
jgi:glycosyltransferase involved in cell wall biosynthesis